MSAQLKDLREQDRLIYPALVRERFSKNNNEALFRVVEEAIVVPLQIMKKTIEGLAMIARVGAVCKKILVADLLVAAELLAAALHGAFHIGSSNLPLAREMSIKRAFNQELIDTLQEGMETVLRVKKELAARAGTNLR